VAGNAKIQDALLLGLTIGTCRIVSYVTLTGSLEWWREIMVFQLAKPDLQQCNRHPRSSKFPLRRIHPRQEYGHVLYVLMARTLVVNRFAEYATTTERQENAKGSQFGKDPLMTTLMLWKMWFPTNLQLWNPAVKHILGCPKLLSRRREWATTMFLKRKTPSMLTSGDVEIVVPRKAN